MEIYLPLTNMLYWSFGSYNDKKRRAKGAGRKVKSKTPPVGAVGPNDNGKRNEYESVMLTARCIAATHDIAPAQSGKTLDPYMYWPTAKSEACALKLIERYPDLVTYAEKNYLGATEMAAKWGSMVARKSTNERAIQIQYINPSGYLRDLHTIWLRMQSLQNRP